MLRLLLYFWLSLRFISYWLCLLFYLLFRLLLFNFFWLIYVSLLLLMFFLALRIILIILLSLMRFFIAFNSLFKLATSQSCLLQVFQYRLLKFRLFPPLSVRTIIALNWWLTFLKRFLLFFLNWRSTSWDMFFILNWRLTSQRLFSILRWGRTSQGFTILDRWWTSKRFVIFLSLRRTSRCLFSVLKWRFCFAWTTFLLLHHLTVSICLQLLYLFILIF